jgi:hypothetical protein
MGREAGLEGWRKSRLHWDSIAGPSNQYTDRAIPANFSEEEEEEEDSLLQRT